MSAATSRSSAKAAASSTHDRVVGRRRPGEPAPEPGDDVGRAGWVRVAMSDGLVEAERCRTAEHGLGAGVVASGPEHPVAGLRSIVHPVSARAASLTSDSVYGCRRGVPGAVAEREQLEQLPSEVLVRRRCGVAPAVEPDEHRRVVGDRADEVVEAARPPS